MNADEYECFICKGTFTKGRSDEEAFEEAKHEFGTTPDEAPMGAVCCECYELFMNWHKDNQAKQ